MRISDWSSDVCSSDLQFPELGIRAGADPEFGELARVRDTHLRARGGDIGVSDAPVAVVHERLPGQRPPPRDRKSVVEGKSVSVRVDLGGRRHIKKNRDLKT